MNYLNIYNSLIHKRKNIQVLLKSECYCERHHIIPRCVGGIDNKDNLVNLTAREHYIAHLLLYKIYSKTEDKYSLLYALIEMCDSHTYKNKVNYNSRIYEKNRLELQKSGLLKKNGSRGGRKCWEKFNNDPELKEKMLKIYSSCQIKSAIIRVTEWDEEKKKEYSKKISDGIKKYYSEHNSVWLGKKHTQISKNKMKESGRKKNILSSKNPMYGKIWIFNEMTYENKIWDKDVEIPSGWTKGRKIKRI